MHIKDGVKSTCKKKDVSMAELLASLAGSLLEYATLVFHYKHYTCLSLPDSRGAFASAGGGVRGAGREEWLLRANMWSQQLQRPDAPAEQGNVGVALSPSGSGSAPRADSRTESSFAI